MAPETIVITSALNPRIVPEEVLVPLSYTPGLSHISKHADQKPTFPLWLRKRQCLHKGPLHASEIIPLVQEPTGLKIITPKEFKLAGNSDPHLILHLS